MSFSVDPRPDTYSTSKPDMAKLSADPRLDTTFASEQKIVEFSADLMPNTTSTPKPDMAELSADRRPDYSLCIYTRLWPSFSLSKISTGSDL